MKSIRFFSDEHPKKRRRIVLTFDEFNNDGPLPHEMWLEIFKNLEPIFMYQLFFVSKDFAELARRALLEGKIQYDDMETHTFKCWQECYMKETATLSAQAKKLYDLVTYRDYAQIEKQKLDPNILFEQVYDDKLLDIISRENIQHLRNVIFNATYSWFQDKTKNDRNIFTAILAYLLPIDETTMTDFYQIMDLAVALNQIAFVDDNKKMLSSDRDYKTGLTHLDLACKFGHEELISIMLQKNGFLRASLLKSKENPLVLAIEGNHFESVNALISQAHEFYANNFQQALFHALDDQKLKILEQLLPFVQSIDNPELPVEYGANNAPFYYTPE